ncbi:penicillin-binding protein 1A [Desulfatirhabdium butyrativorans]|uniref:penicillin-binding protein 1A n=1 Tax=Desulfatirhabdium butyrativorans TaxID=340467 RepID=UPI000413FE6D|nr:penicillin-binding protein 1A [Desulfatirhabdium butyrativorans]
MTPKRSDILKKRAKAQSGTLFPGMLKWMIRLALIGMAVGIPSLVVFYYYVNEDLPQIKTLADYNPPAITEVYADDGQIIAEFFRERRRVLPINDIPEKLKQAFIAAEDSRFYSHPGIDLLGIARAVFKNIEAGGIVQGGSTITQQVTKSFLLTPEKSFMRKFKEAILAYRIDKAFTKDEILYLYLNQIYLGQGAYGVESAAEVYFGKSAKELNLAEMAVLAGLPQAPTRYSPIRYPERAKQRQFYVLNRMVAEGYISEAEAKEAMMTPLKLQPARRPFPESVSYYSEHVRRYLETKYGSEAFLTGGYKVYTAANVEMHRQAYDAMQKGLRELDKRQGYRGPIRHLEPMEIEAFCRELQEKTPESHIKPDIIVPGVVTDVQDAQQRALIRIGKSVGILPLSEMKWARKPNPESRGAAVRKVSDVFKPGDVAMVRVLESPAGSKDGLRFSLEQTPAVQSAIVCIEAGNGNVKVMIGGRNYNESQFNRAIQARRQPGSAFKPIVYAAAIDKGYTPATIMMDTPVSFQNEDTDPVWNPKNYDRQYHGRVLLRTALEKSLNVVTVKILQDIGIDTVVDYAKRLGIQSPIDRNLSIALGSSVVSPLELTTAFSVFANQGELIQPLFITKIEDKNGNVLETFEPEKKNALDPRTAYIMTNLMEGVVKNGTARRVLALNRPVAGKTGTTSNLNDAWFEGFTPQLITGVWVGFDDMASLGRGETGASAAIPIWMGFMKQALANLPATSFPIPEGIVFAQIDADTGLLAGPHSSHVIFECFKEGTVPQILEAPAETQPGKMAPTQPEDLFKSDM